MVLQLTNKHLNFSGVNINKLDSNFERNFYWIVKQFNDAKNYNNDAKLNAYNTVELQLKTYVELFAGTKVLTDYIEKIEEIYDKIYFFKVKSFPEVYATLHQTFKERYRFTSI